MGYGVAALSALAMLFGTLGAAGATLPDPPPGERALPPEARTPLAEIAGIPLTTTTAAARIEDAPAAVREAYEAAMDLVADGNLVLAEVRLDEALAKSPDAFGHYELFYELARIKEALRGPGAARPAADRAAQLRPGAADIRYLLGDLDDRAGNADGAIANFRTATLAAERELNNPHVTAAWFRLAALLERKGLLTAAEESYARFDDAIWESHVERRSAPPVAAILARNPAGGVELRLALLERLGETDRAVAVAAAAAARQPDSPDLARRHVRALLAAGRAEEALVLCRRRLAAWQPGGPNAAAAGGFLSLAIEAARAANKLSAWLDEVVAAVERGEQLDLARKLARKIADSSAAAESVRLWAAIQRHELVDARTAWGLAQALRKAGEYQKSFAALAEFLRTAHDHTGVPGDELLAWMRVSPPPGGFLEAVTTASTAGERDFATDFVLATAAAAAQQNGLAEQLLRACLEAQAEYAPAEAAWGQMCLNAFQWDAARQHAEAALRIAPGYALAQLVKAEAAAGLDENEIAAQAFREAIRAAAQDAIYRAALAAHSRRTGELTAAQRYYQEALGLDPSSGAALEGLIDSYVDERKFDLAKQQLARAEQSDVPEDALRRVRTTVRYVDAQYQDEHLSELRRQVDQHPADGETALKLAWGLLVRGRTDDAATAVERAAQILPEDPRTLTYRGRISAERLEFESAIAAFERLRQRHPNREETLRRLAEAYLNDFRCEEGRTIIRRLIELARTENEKEALLFRLAVSHEEFREFDDALRVIDDALRTRPNSELFRIARIRALRAAGRHSESLEAATAWLDAATDELFRRDEFIRSAVAAKAYDAALKRIEPWRATEADEEELRPLQWMIKVLLAARRTDEALAALEALRPANLEQDFQRRMLLARCQAAAGKFDAALAELDALLADRTFQRSPRLDSCRGLLVELCMKYNAPDAALERLERWRAEALEAGLYEELQWLRRKHSVLSAANRVEESIAVMERILERLAPDAGEYARLYIGIHNDLGYTLVDRGEQVERATALIRRAVASLPLEPAYLDSLGWALYKAGDFSGAQKHISRAVRMRRGQDAVLYDHLGDAQQRHGDSAAAKKSWQKSIELIENDAERIAEYENEEDSAALPAPVELLARVRAKLAALERGTAPEVAPLAPGR